MRRLVRPLWRPMAAAVTLRHRTTTAETTTDARVSPFLHTAAAGPAPAFTRAVQPSVAPPNDQTHGGSATDRGEQVQEGAIASSTVSVAAVTVDPSTPAEMLLDVLRFAGTDGRPPLRSLVLPLLPADARHLLQAPAAAAHRTALSALSVAVASRAPSMSDEALLCAAAALARLGVVRCGAADVNAPLQILAQRWRPARSYRLHSVDGTATHDGRDALAALLLAAADGELDRDLLLWVVKRATALKLATAPLHTLAALCHGAAANAVRQLAAPSSPVNRDGRSPSSSSASSPPSINSQGAVDLLSRLFSVDTDEEFIRDECVALSTQAALQLAAVCSSGRPGDAFAAAAPAIADIQHSLSAVAAWLELRRHATTRRIPGVDIAATDATDAVLLRNVVRPLLLGATTDDGRGTDSLPSQWWPVRRFTLADQGAVLESLAAAAPATDVTVAVANVTAEAVARDPAVVDAATAASILRGAVAGQLPDLALAVLAAVRPDHLATLHAADMPRSAVAAGFEDPREGHDGASSRPTPGRNNGEAHAAVVGTNGGLREFSTLLRKLCAGAEWSRTAAGRGEVHRVVIAALGVAVTAAADHSDSETLMAAVADAALLTTQLRCITAAPPDVLAQLCDVASTRDTAGRRDLRRSDGAATAAVKLIAASASVLSSPLSSSYASPVDEQRWLGALAAQQSLLAALPRSLRRPQGHAARARRKVLADAVALLDATEHRGAVLDSTRQWL